VWGVWAAVAHTKCMAVPECNNAHCSRCALPCLLLMHLCSLDVYARVHSMPLWAGDAAPKDHSRCCAHVAGQQSVQLVSTLGCRASMCGYWLVLHFGRLLLLLLLACGGCVFFAWRPIHQLVAVGICKGHRRDKCTMTCTVWLIAHSR
jgi:hypothetical protein